MNNNSGAVPIFEAFLISSKHVSLSQLYASLVLQQMSLDMQSVDVGLATEIDYYRKRFNGAATSTLNTAAPNFIGMLADASNFCNFYKVYLDNSISKLQNAYQDETDKINAANGILYLTMLANRLILALEFAIVQEDTVLKDLGSYMPKYEKSIEDSIQLLNQSAKLLSTKIEALGKEASEAIKEIVSGGKEVGTAISTLGIGVLTTISGGLKPPSKDDSPKPPNVDFVIQSITLASSGTSTMSAASKKLEQVNVALAKAYGELAKQNMLVAIAKAIQVQNNMYYDILKQTLGDLKALLDVWTKVGKSFEDLHTSITNINSQDQASLLASSVKADQEQWDLLDKQLDKIKTDLTKTNSNFIRQIN